MSGTPSKDRAEAHMETGHNLSYGAVGLSRAIEFETLAIMIAIELAKAHAEGRKTGFAEGTKRAAEIVRDHDEVVNLRTGKRSLDTRSEGNLVGLAYLEAILSETGEA